MSLHNIIDDNIEALHAGTCVLQQVTPEQFTEVSQPYFSASAGKHFRHILDHYLSFFDGLSELRIEYDLRARELRVEQDKDYSLQLIQSIISQLNQLKSLTITDSPLQVLLTTSTDTTKPSAVPSSIARELVFLQGHTTHHFAIIAGILKLLDVPVSDSFGVAPSTLMYERGITCAPHPG